MAAPPANNAVARQAHAQTRRKSVSMENSQDA